MAARKSCQSSELLGLAQEAGIALMGQPQARVALHEPRLIDHLACPFRDVRHVVVSPSTAAHFPGIKSGNGFTLLQYFVWRRALLAAITLLIPVACVWRLFMEDHRPWVHHDLLYDPIVNRADKFMASLNFQDCKSDDLLFGSVCENFIFPGCTVASVEKTCGDKRKVCCHDDDDGTCADGTGDMYCTLDAMPHTKLPQCEPGTPVVYNPCDEDRDSDMDDIFYTPAPTPEGRPAFKCRTDAKIVQECGSLQDACCADPEGRCEQGDELVCCVNTSTFDASAPPVIHELEACPEGADVQPLPCGTLCDNATVAQGCGNMTRACALPQGVQCLRAGMAKFSCSPEGGTIRLTIESWQGADSCSEGQEQPWYTDSTLLPGTQFGECRPEQHIIVNSTIVMIRKELGMSVPKYAKLTCEESSQTIQYHMYSDPACGDEIGVVEASHNCQRVYSNPLDNDGANFANQSIDQVQEDLADKAWHVLVTADEDAKFQRRVDAKIHAPPGQCSAGTPEAWQAGGVEFGNSTFTMYNANSTGTYTVLRHMEWLYEKHIGTKGYEMLMDSLEWIQFASLCWRWVFSVLALVTWQHWRVSAALNIIGWCVPIIALFALFLLPWYLVNNMDAEAFVKDLVNTTCLSDNLQALVKLVIDWLNDSSPLPIFPFTDDTSQVVDGLHQAINLLQSQNSDLMISYASTVVQVVALVFFTMLAVVSTAPVAFALLPGLRRGAKNMKLVFPQATFIGWLYYLVPFLYLPLVLAVAMVVIQMFANQYFTVAVVLFLLSQCLDPLMVNRFATRPFLDGADLRQSKSRLPRWVGWVRMVCGLGLPLFCFVGTYLATSSVVFGDLLSSVNIKPSGVANMVLKFINTTLLTTVTWADILLYVTVRQHVDCRNNPGSVAALNALLDEARSEVIRETELPKLARFVPEE